MQQVLWLAGDVIAYSGFAAIVFYAPFALTWFRGLIVPFALMFIWSVIRMISIVAFREDSPPGMGFVVAPFSALFLAFVLRTLKVIVFKLPFLEAMEDRIRLRLKGGKISR